MIIKKKQMVKELEKVLMELEKTTATYAEEHNIKREAVYAYRTGAVTVMIKNILGIEIKYGGSENGYF